jgi:hypothetical protein
LLNVLLQLANKNWIQNNNKKNKKKSPSGLEPVTFRLVA